MTTIITKNGSGAPTAGQLSEGELAVDLTNKELYTKSGSTVIKIGSQGGSTGTFTDLTATSSFTSPGIDDNANATAITIDASENVGIGTASPDATLTVKPQSAAIGTHENQNWSYDSTNTGVEFDLKLKQVVSSGLVKYKFDLRNSGTSYDNNLVLDRGNVGIGESNPSTALDVSTNAGNGDAGQLVKVTNTNTSSGTAKTLTIGTDNYFASNPGMTIVAESGLSFGVGDGSDLAAQRDLVITSSGDFLVGSGSRTYTVGSGTYEIDAAGGLNLSSGRDNGASMTFEVSNSERMRIDAAGNVGIGTASPTSGAGWAKFINIGGTDNNALILDGTESQQAAVGAVDGLYLDCVGSSTASKNRIIFRTQSANSNYNGSERMRIDSSGNLLVGTTTTIGTGTEGVQIAQNLIITGRNQTSDQTHHVFKNPNGTVGRIRTLNNATDYVTSSDERLKENIVDAPAGNIDSIKVRSFDWKADGEHQDYGFIAQELETVAPYAVSKGETENDMWGVDYSKLVPMLVKEIQDLKAEVAALKGA